MSAAMTLALVAAVPLALLRAGRSHRLNAALDGLGHDAAASPGQSRELMRRLGERVRLAVGRPSDDRHDHAIGRMLIVSAACFGIDPVLGVVAFGACAGWPVLNSRRSLQARQHQVLRELPEIVDLYSVALHSGHNVATASRQVVRSGDGLFAQSLAEAIERVDRGQSLDLALEDLATEFGVHVRPLTSVLVSGLRYGAPIGASLERVATDLRLERRRHAERAARRLPVAMLFPLVVCVLPAFGLLTVVPVLFESLRSLSLP